jgi:Xaa-Pro dipeptidase
LDFGAKYNRYCSDITRAFVAGNASKYHKEVYETVYEAQQIAFESLRAGIDGKDVYKKVENFIASTKFKGKFIHSLGHGLGLTVHDYGFLASNQSLKLKENMVFTVEPGIYIKGWGGIRLEDDVLIKKNGIEFFTKPQKELIEI